VHVLTALRNIVVVVVVVVLVALVVVNLLTVWCKAVIRWLSSEEHHESNLQQSLTTLLPQIRFPMIFADQLAEFEQTSFEREHHQLFSPYLLSAYR